MERKVNLNRVSPVFLYIRNRLPLPASATSTRTEELKKPLTGSISYPNFYIVIRICIRVHQLIRKTKTICARGDGECFHNRGVSRCSRWSCRAKLSGVGTAINTGGIYGGCR